MVHEIFMVFEQINGGELADRLTTGPYHGTNKGGWNAKKRVYFSRTQANVYRRRLEKMNRSAIVVRFVPDSDIE